MRQLGPNEIITLRLTPMEGFLLGMMIDAMAEELSPQLESLNQDQRTYLEIIQRIRTFLPVTK